MVSSIKGNNAKFVIYGGGEVGNNCFKALTNNGFIVNFALDKIKSGDHIIEGIHTYKLGTEPKEIDKSIVIVIICLANGLIHKEVADCLYKEGYRYIIFLPMKHFLSDKTKIELTRKYNTFLVGDDLVKNEIVHDYGAYLKPDLHMDNAIVREGEDTIIILCGIEILFSESMELWQGDKSKVHIKLEYEDRSILANHPCKILFDFLDMDTGSVAIYFSSKKNSITDEEAKIELSAREELYRIFKREHNKGMDFFIEGAPLAVWNPKNYWNLVGGHHRTLYLLHERHNLLPIKVSKNDFIKWCNKEVYEMVCNYILDNDIKALYAPLPHPGFINFPSRYENNGVTKLEKTIGFLVDKNVSVMSSLDCLEDEGYFARNMNRIGVLESVFASDNEEQLQLAELCNCLLYRNEVILRNIKYGECQYDIVFGKEEEKEQLLKLCKRYLFIEKNISMTSVSINADDVNYMCLLQEYRNGKIHEFGVYTLSND